jgi:hypothetical protein
MKEQIVIEAAKELSTLTYILTTLKLHLSEQEVEALKRIHKKLLNYYELTV